MATPYDSGLILISVEYTTHCYVDFERPARTFICFGAHLKLNVLLRGYDDRKCTPVCYIYACNHTPMATGRSRLWIDIDFGGIYDTLSC